MQISFHDQDPDPDAGRMALARLLDLAPAELPSHLNYRVVPGALLPEQLAAQIAAGLGHALAQRGRAVIAVSGGRSPVPLFDALASCPLGWDRVDVTLIDERCVRSSDPASNAALVRAHLLQGRAADARFVPWVNDQCTPATEPELLARSVDAHLKSLGRTDVAVLGLGTDGHTASLFPHAEGVASLLQAIPHLSDGPPPDGGRCAVVSPRPLPAGAPYVRLTQTPHQILSARRLVLPVSGADKLPVLRLALRQAVRGPDPSCPVAYFLAQTRTPVDLWIGC